MNPGPLLQIGLTHYLVVAAILFALGVLAMVARRNAIGVLIGIELVLNAANLNLVAFGRFTDAGPRGPTFAIFVIMLAAAEAAIGLAIVLGIYQTFQTIDVEATETLRG